VNLSPKSERVKRQWTIESEIAGHIDVWAADDEGEVALAAVTQGPGADVGLLRQKPVRALPEVTSVFVDGGRQAGGKKETRLATLIVNLSPKRRRPR
jgi:hypothetical protein